MGRMLSALLVCALLACGPVRAEDSNNGDAATKTSPAASTDKSTNAPAAKSEAKKNEAAKPADYREEIEELRQLMREQAQQLSEQQKQLELLRAQLSAAGHKSEVSATAPAAAMPDRPTTGIRRHTFQRRGITSSTRCRTASPT